jgi:hypothetical protein
MWTKYDYLCTDCDALMEITTLQNIREWRGWCSCGSANLINIGVSDATVSPTIDTIEMLDQFKSQTGIAIDSLDVMKVTPTQVVKINSNPYN